MALSIFSDLNLDMPDIGWGRRIATSQNPLRSFDMFPLGSCRNDQMR
jgi:hypothetical protein